MQRPLGAGQQVNLTEYIRNSFKLTDESIAYTLAELSDFISKDKTLLNAIHALLRNRLKYATGNLMKSISLEFKPYAVKSKGYVAGTHITDVYGIFNVVLNTKAQGSAYIFGKRQALLGIPEIQSEVPTIEELTKWIRGKEKYFKPQLSLIDRKNQAERASLRLARAFMLIGSKKVSKTFPNATIELATLIRDRMSKRKAKTGSASKGSQFAFLGYYTKSMSNTIEKKSAFMTPKYKEFATPLLTEQGELGEIQILVNELIKNYMKKLMSYKPSSGDFSKISLSSELNQFAKKNLFPSIVLEEVYKGMEYLDAQLNVLASMSNTAKKTGKYKQAVAQREQAIKRLSVTQSRIMLDMKATKTVEFRKNAVEFAQQMQSLALNMKISSRKRRAIRRKR